MKNIIGVLLVAIMATQLTACGKSQAVMCSEIADKTSEITKSAIGKLDEESEKEMKGMGIEMCMELPKDTVKAQHKMLIK